MCVQAIEQAYQKKIIYIKLRLAKKKGTRNNIRLFDRLEIFMFFMYNK